MIEKWKEIYNGYYKISNKGRLKRNKPGQGTYIGRTIKPKFNKNNGYLYYIVSINGKAITKEIHRLVAEAFVGQCPKGKEVNHIDGNKKKNNYRNLEYTTRKENIRHAFRIGLCKNRYRPKGESNVKAKLTKAQVILIRLVYRIKALGRTEIAKIFDVTRGTIKDITIYRTWKHVK